MLGKRTGLTAATVLSGVILVLAQGGASAVTATPGSPDPTFGTGGSVVEGSSNSYGGVVDRQANGDLVFPTEINGQAALVRMAGNGGLDDPFGVDGVATPPVNRLVTDDGNEDTLQHATARSVFGYSGFTTVSEASDGTYYVGGYADSSHGEADGFVAHLLSDGALDPSFGQGGLVYYPLSYTGFASTYAICPVIPVEVAALPEDQGVVVSNNLGSCLGDRLHEYNELGQENTSFLAQANAAFGGPNDAVQELQVIVFLNSYLLVNTCPKFDSIEDAGVTALQLDGSIETGWGNDGCSPALTPSSPLPPPDSQGSYPDEISSEVLAVSPANNILVAANSNDASWAAMLSADGQVDPSFGDGTSAMAPTPLDNTGVSWVAAATVSDSGEAVLLGTNQGATPVSGISDGGGGAGAPGEVAWMQADGATDATFGVGGVVTLPSGLLPTGLEVQPDYRVVVSGVTGPPGCANSAVMVPDPPDAATLTNNYWGPFDCTAVLQGLVDTEP